MELYVAIVVALLAPALLAWLNARVQRKSKEQDYKRQDKVAEAARLAVESTRKAEQEIEKKLETIHALVNSNLTTQLRESYEGLLRELPLMMEIVELKKKAGLEPTIEILAAIEATKLRIGEMKTEIVERIAQAEVMGETKKEVTDAALADEREESAEKSVDKTD